MLRNLIDDGILELRTEPLDALEYDNLERIWIERTEQRVREGRKKVTKSLFELHVIHTAT